jgi:Ca2+-binding RTX toxin-like protein
MRGYGGGDSYSGGLGDDTYIISSEKDQVFELKGEGIDTVRSSVYHVLEANIENLILEGSGAWYGGGNALDNVIIGNEFAQQLNGGAGNDVLIGGAGKDTFIVTAGNGSDVIADFATGVDKIQLGGYGVTGFGQLQSLAQQVGSDTVLHFTNGEDLILRGVKAASLVSSDFTYEINRSAMTLNFGDEFNALSLYSRAAPGAPNTAMAARAPWPAARCAPSPKSTWTPTGAAPARRRWASTPSRSTTAC